MISVCLIVEKELHHHLVEGVGQVDGQWWHVQLQVIDDGYTANGWPLFEVDADHGATADVSLAYAGAAVAVGYGKFGAEVSRWAILKLIESWIEFILYNKMKKLKVLVFLAMDIIFRGSCSFETF